MIRELSIHESFDWLRSTLEHLASIPRLKDDDFAYIVFETLAIDVPSGLSDVALDRLVFAYAITETAKSEIQSLRTFFEAVVGAAHESPSLPVEQIRRDPRWLDAAQEAERIRSAYVHEDWDLRTHYRHGAEPPNEKPAT